MHEAHEAFESEDPNAKGMRGFLAKWVNGFNIPRMGINAYRWYQLHKENSNLRDHALNVAFMLSLSHSLEMASGPLGITAGHMFGLPAWTDWALGSVGAIISIPGLDPLCIGLIAIYPKKQIRNAVQSARLFVVKIGGTGARLLGFNFLARQLLTDVTGYERLQRALAEGKQTIVLDHTPLTYHLRTSSGEPLVTLQLEKTSNDDVTLKSAHFSPTALNEDFRSEIRQSLLPFGWNIRDAIFQSLKMLQNNRADLLQNQIHVARISAGLEHWTDVHYQRKAVSLKSQKVLCGLSAWSLTKDYELPDGRN